MKRKSEGLSVIPQNSERAQGYNLLNLIQHSNLFRNVPDTSTLIYNTSENGNAIFHNERCWWYFLCSWEALIGFHASVVHIGYGSFMLISGQYIIWNIFMKNKMKDHLVKIGIYHVWDVVILLCWKPFFLERMLLTWCPWNVSFILIQQNWGGADCLCSNLVSPEIKL